MKRIKAISKFGAALFIMLSMLCHTSAALSTPDIQAPAAPEKLTADNITHTTISLSWTSSYDDRSVKGYQVYRDGKKIISTSKTTYIDKDLVPGRQYTYFVKAYDAAGNLSESSIAIRLSTIKDPQSPSAPTSLKASSVTYTSAALSWKPSTDNIGVKGYEVYCNGKMVASTSEACYEYKKLIPGTSNEFYVKAFDKAGNYSARSNSISVNTTSDKTAPSSPGKLKATSVTVTEVNLTWSPASDNVKVKGYDIIRNGVKIGTTTKTSYLNKGLVPGKKYTYIVRAYDISGNLSDNSTPLEVTTLKDIQIPTAPSELKITAVKGASVSLEWTASTDNSKIAGYQIYCNGIVIATAAGTSRTVKSPFGLGYDEFWIKAYDQAGNLSGSSNTVIAVTPSE